MKLKKTIAAFLAILIGAGGMIPLDFSTLSENKIHVNAESDSGVATDTATEIGATNSIGQLLTEALEDENTDFEANGFYNIADLEYDVETGKVSVQFSTMNFCNLLICFYDDDGIRMLTSVTQKVAPESETAELQVDTSLLEDTFLIKAYLLDDLQIPLTDVYVCNTYTSDMQEILSATVDDFNEEYVINLDDDTTTNFLVLTEGTKIMTVSDTENVLINADYANGVYQFANPDEMLSGLQEGDFFYYQNQQETIVDKVSSIEMDGDKITIVSGDTDIQEAFEFVKIEAASSDFDILEMGNTREHAELISYDKGGNEQEIAPVMKMLPPLAKSEESLWDHFSFTYEIYNNELYSKKSDDTVENEWSEKLEITGSLTFMIDPHINCYWSLPKKYFEIHFEIVTETDFVLSMAGSYEGTVAKLGEITFGGTGIYFKLEPQLQVEVEASLDVNLHSDETFGFHFDTTNGRRSLHELPVVTSKDPSFEGKIGLYLDFQPKLVVITEKAANISFVTKVGVVVSAQTYLPNPGIVEPDKADIHECASCISGKLYFSVKLGWEGKAFNGKIKIGDITNLTLNKEIPLFDYYISSFGDTGFTKCPHHKYRVRFRILDEHLLPVEKASIHLTKEPSDIWKKFGFTDEMIKAMAMDETLVTDEKGIVDTWFPKSMESNTPIQITVSYDGYKDKVTQFQFKGDSKKITLYIYPEGYYGEFFKDLLEMLSDLEDKFDTEETMDTVEDLTENQTDAETDSTVEPTEELTETENIEDSTEEPTEIENVIASGECGAEGNNVTWKLDEAGTLKIQGHGIMKNWDASGGTYSVSNSIVTSSEIRYLDEAPPWYELRYNINRIIIQESVTTIGNGAFAGCINVRSVDIYAPVTVIGKRSFWSLTYLSEISLPNNIQIIGEYAFFACRSLTNIDIPDSVTDIGKAAFSKCISLTDVKLSTRLTKIEDDLFEECKSLSSITIPEGVESIRRGFAGTAITELDIPSTVNYLISDFWNMSNLKRINVDSNNPYYCDVDGILYNKSKTELRAYPCAHEQIEFSVPDTVTEIRDNAFDNCTEITNIKLSPNLTRIGSHAFDSCSNLTTINIPDNITIISESTFYGCSSLKSITIPHGVTTICGSAFYFCSGLTSIVIPDSVTSIGNYAFSRCSGLETLTIQNSVSSIGYDAFSYCKSLTDIYYLGTEEEWNAIEIGINNDYLISAAIHFDSETPSALYIPLFQIKQ